MRNFYNYYSEASDDVEYYKNKIKKLEKTLAEKKIELAKVKKEEQKKLNLKYLKGGALGYLAGNAIGAAAVVSRHNHG